MRSGFLRYGPRKNRIKIYVELPATASTDLIQYQTRLPRCDIQHLVDCREGSYHITETIHAAHEEASCDVFGLLHGIISCALMRNAQVRCGCSD